MGRIMRGRNPYSLSSPESAYCSKRDANSEHSNVTIPTIASSSELDLIGAFEQKIWYGSSQAIAHLLLWHRPQQQQQHKQLQIREHRPGSLSEAFLLPESPLASYPSGSPPASSGDCSSSDPNTLERSSK
mmetsp:Transcript_33133/g.80487  ORF Transcript_33133/g.80487 Transcript_33133/m.80487 type:complete len:130 (-) Transcript_33133:468-857(-)